MAFPSSMLEIHKKVAIGMLEILIGANAGNSDWNFYFSSSLAWLICSLRKQG